MKYWVILFVLLSTTATWSRSQGQLTACKSNQKNIGTALEMWWTDHDETYPKALSQLVPNYLRLIPECPTMMKDSYSHTYQVSADQKAFGIHCHGVDHFKVKNFPAYNAQYGLFERPGTTSTLTTCEKNLTKLDKLAKEHLAEKPKDFQGLDSSEKLQKTLYTLSCDSHGPGTHSYPYHLSTTDTEYEFICMNLDHIQDNLMPLQPRFNSQTGLSKQTFQDAPTTRKSMPKWIPGLAIFSLLGIAGLAVALK